MRASIAQLWVMLILKIYTCARFVAFIVTPLEYRCSAVSVQLQALSLPQEVSDYISARVGEK